MAWNGNGPLALKPAYVGVREFREERRLASRILKDGNIYTSYAFSSRAPHQSVVITSLHSDMDLGNGARGLHGNVLSPAELEFLAEDVHVNIVPSIKTNPLQFINVR